MMYRIYVLEKEVRFLVGFADDKHAVSTIVRNLLSLGHIKILVEGKEEEVKK